MISTFKQYDACRNTRKEENGGDVGIGTWVSDITLHGGKKKEARDARVGIYPLLVEGGSVGPVMWGLLEECSFGMRSLSGTQIFSTSVTSDLVLAACKATINGYSSSKSASFVDFEQIWPLIREVKQR